MSFPLSGRARGALRRTTGGKTLSKEEKLREEIEGPIRSKFDAGLDQQINNILDAERERSHRGVGDQPRQGVE
jgi:hypothetical protein